MTGPRDWDKEMAEIDKLLAAGSPPAPSNVPARAEREPSSKSPGPVARSGAEVVTRRGHIAGVWVRALLGVAAVSSLPFWPYAKSCGTLLYAYLGATLAVIVVGVWTMRHAWTHRRGIAHTIGVLVLVAGLALAAAAILPHTRLVGTPLAWTCP